MGHYQYLQTIYYYYLTKFYTNLFSLTLANTKEQTIRNRFLVNEIHVEP